MVLNSTSFLNNTGVVGDVINGLSGDVTGSLFLTLLLVLLLLFGLAIAFRIPIEYTALFVTPLMLALMAGGGAEFLMFGTLLLIYLGIIFGKNFFIK